MDFTELIDLASERLGAEVLAANDEFFAGKENLIKPSPAVWREGEYTDRGKWMDGWETRRRREPGYDWCIVQLGCAGRVRGVVVDTSHFTGNYPDSCSVDACAVEDDQDPLALAQDDARWTEILPRSKLRGDHRNAFGIDDDRRYTHVRLNIFPDGGVARLRVHGVVLPDWDQLLRGSGPIDLAAAEHGAWIVDSSDAFYGNPAQLIMPGQSTGMHDGWETKRRRGPGNDWVVVRLAARGTVRRAVLDTAHFKGNAPGWCSLEACDIAGAAAPSSDTRWTSLLDKKPLQPDTVHDFAELHGLGPVTHVRLSIYPDGGVARLRLWGEPDADPRS